MITKATVTAVDGNIATVKARRTSACDGCHKGAEGCVACSLMGPGGEMTATALNEIGAEVGDAVEIESDGKRVLFYCALVFLFPVLSMLSGYWITSFFTDSEPLRYVISAVAVVLSLGVAWLYSRSVGKRSPDIKIVRIITEE